MVDKTWRQLQRLTRGSGRQDRQLWWVRDDGSSRQEVMVWWRWQWQVVDGAGQQWAAAPLGLDAHDDPTCDQTRDCIRATRYGGRTIEHAT
jgi:hypothetical protein